MSGPRGVLIVGSGKRVLQAGLPALLRMPAEFEVRSVFAKHAKEVESGGRRFEVRAFDGFEPGDLAGVDLVYLAVTKAVVPRVLARLAACSPSATDLLIDTPVVRFKHYRHVALTRRFRAAWVAEDCSTLPWIPTVERAFAELDLGELRRVVFTRSAYAYHGVATAKTLLGCDRVVRAVRRKGPAGTATRELRFTNGATAVMHEPRDYSVGHVVLEGERGSISDAEGAADHRLEPVVAGGAWRGFRVGGVETALDEDQIALLGAAVGAGDAGKTVTARMDDLKRVGFLGLLRGIAGGAGAYPLEEAVDDMVVDYHLEKVGRFLANPLTTPRSALGRGLLSLLSRVAGG